MTVIRVHRPDMADAAADALELAPRVPLPTDARLLVVDNGKPNAKALLSHIGQRLRDLLGVAHVEVHTKPSAGAPLDADVTRMLAARSHLVISGLGD